MITRLAIIIILLVSSSEAICQITITGTVISKMDKSRIPGISIVEKGTNNGTTTDLEGNFSVTVFNPNAILFFSFVGMIPREYPLNGQRHIRVEMKYDCHKDFFDSQRIAVYAITGLINTPIGGQIEISSPFTRLGVVKGLFNYQTNLKDTQFQNGQIELSHIISTCDFDLDFKLNYRKVNFNEEFSAQAFSIQPTLNLNNITVFAGYSHLKFNKTEISSTKPSSGILIGFGTTLGRPFYPIISGKASFFKNSIEYQTSMQGGFKKLLFFTNFYKLKSFTEISFGIGTAISYRKKRHPN